jgi:hypothetical protein
MLVNDVQCRLGAEIIYDGELLFELMIPLLMMGIQMGEMSKLGWLID